MRRSNIMQSRRPLDRDVRDDQAVDARIERDLRDGSMARWLDALSVRARARIPTMPA
jgi:hypothetical protein